MMRFVFAGVLILLPCAVMAQSALDWIAGDWGIETAPDFRCAVNPMRLAVLDDGKTIHASLPKADEMFGGMPSSAVTATVLSDDGNMILMHHNTFQEPYFILLSKDRASLRMGRCGDIEDASTGMRYTRCPDATPES